MPNVGRFSAAVAVLLWLGGFPAVAEEPAATTYRWISNAGGEFANPANWVVEETVDSPSDLPTPRDGLIMGAVTANVAKVVVRQPVDVGGVRFVGKWMIFELNGHPFRVHGGRITVGEKQWVSARAGFANGPVMTGVDEPTEVLISVAGADSRLLLEGKQLLWEHRGTREAGHFVVGAGDWGQLVLSGGATLRLPDEGTMFVARSGTSRGEVTVRDGSMAVGNLVIGGTFSERGGAGTLTVNRGGTVGITGSLKMWPASAVVLDGGRLALPASDMRWDGRLTGTGLVLTEEKRGAALVFENAGVIAVEPLKGPITLAAFDYTHGPEGRLVVQLGASASAMRDAGGVALLHRGAVATVDGGVIELLPHAKGRYAVNDGFNVLFAPRIEMVREPEVKLGGELGERFGAKVAVVRAGFNRVAGLQALRVVLTAKAASGGGGAAAR